MLRRLAAPFAVLVFLPTACSDSDEAPIEPEFRDFPVMNPVEPAALPAPDDAICSIKVTGKGTKQMETEYLPSVIACEAPANADLEMLKAQAIAARSYAYYSAVADGGICDSQGCQVFSCGNTAKDIHRQAVADTSGVVLAYKDILTVGFFVAGDSTPNADCSGNSSGVANTEKWVTYNEGNSGFDVEQTALGWRHKTTDTDYGQNRGCLSQWGAQCLAEDRGFKALDILRYYYGEDIELRFTEGACVGDTDIEGGGGDGGGDDGGDGGDGDGDVGGTPCDIDPDGVTIIDNGNACLNLSGPSKYWRTESDGVGGSLRWTKSTKSTEYNTAKWQLNPVEDGEYRLEVHIEDGFSTGTKAKYEIVDRDSAQTVTVDQTQGGWVPVGTANLEAGVEDQHLRMSDAIGVKGQILQVDALRIMPADLDCEGDDCGTQSVSEGPNNDAGSSVGRGDEAVGCSIGGSGSGPAGALALLALLGLRRRRD